VTCAIAWTRCGACTGVRPPAIRCRRRSAGRSGGSPSAAPRGAATTASSTATTSGIRTARPAESRLAEAARPGPTGTVNRCLLALLARAHQQHGYRRGTRHVLGVAAEQGSPHAASTVGSDDDEVREPVVRLLAYLIGEPATGRIDQHRVRRDALCHRLVARTLQHLLGILAHHAHCIHRDGGSAFQAG